MGIRYVTDEANKAPEDLIRRLNKTVEMAVPNRPSKMMHHSAKPEPGSCCVRETKSVENKNPPIGMPTNIRAKEVVVMGSSVVSL